MSRSYEVPSRASDSGPDASSRDNSIEDCLDEAQEALALAQVAQVRQSTGDRERLLMWIRDAQDWLAEAERILK